MERLFYNKKISILVVAMAVVVIFLVCLLLVMLTQLTSLRQTANEICEILNNAELDKQQKEEQLQYKNTDKYVIDWAVSMGYIPNTVYNFIQEK